MKFCAVVCEYNPFHNGHKYQLDRIRKESGCDGILCVMSGNFTQRGDVAVAHKLVRARHAVQNGADVVLELPAAFAVSAAEGFAAGAVKLIASIPDVKVLAFGCESGGKQDFLKAARATLSEDKQFKALLKENMKDGSSYVKARTATVLSLNADVDKALLTSPNNILGVEYCRALLAAGSSVEPLPIPREGGGFSDATLYKNFSSASALRAALADGSRRAMKAVKGNLPADVYRDLLDLPPLPYREAAVCALLSRTAEEVNRCPDCTEGLENRLRALAKSNPSYDELLSKAVSKRYTLARVKRILAQNFLGIERRTVHAFLDAPLYYKVLCVRRKTMQDCLASLSRGSFPVLMRRSDAGALKRDALACFETDVHANDLYNALMRCPSNEYESVIW